ncbi:MAG: hypothetical protein AAB545_02065 [Patescibacteria group bacterium]
MNDTGVVSIRVVYVESGYVISCPRCGEKIIEGQYYIAFSAELRPYCLAQTVSTICCGENVQILQLFKNREEAESAKKIFKRIIALDEDPDNFSLTSPKDFGVPEEPSFTTLH